MRPFLSIKHAGRMADTIGVPDDELEDVLSWITVRVDDVMRSAPVEQVALCLGSQHPRFGPGFVTEATLWVWIPNEALRAEAALVAWRALPRQ